MSITDELTGTFALVNPKLLNDPGQHQNQVGIITEADLEKDDIYVSFGKGGQSLYSSDALLVLKSNATVYSELLTGHHQLSNADFKKLFEVNLLQQSTRSGHALEAIEILRDNPGLHQYALVALSGKLGIAPPTGIDLNQARPASRVR